MRKRIACILMLGFFVIAGAMPVYAAEQRFTAEDRKFFRTAASSGMMEMQLGEMAQKKAQSQEVRDFAGRMVADHGKAHEGLKNMAQLKNLKMPARLDPRHKSTMDKISRVSGPDFDKQYIRIMVKDHARDIAMFQNAQQKVKDPDLTGWSSKTLPVLEDHLKQAKDLAQKLGIDVKQLQPHTRRKAEKRK